MTTLHRIAAACAAAGSDLASCHCASQAIGWSLCHGLVRLQELEQVYAPFPPAR